MMARQGHGVTDLKAGPPWVTPQGGRAYALSDDEKQQTADRIHAWTVITIARDGIMPQVENLLDSLALAGASIERHMGSSDIVEARSSAATRALDGQLARPAETLLWIDSDTEIHPADACRLFLGAERSGGLVTAISTSRGRRSLLTVFEHEEEPRKVVLGCEPRPDRYHRVRYAGFGCVAMPVDVLRRMVEWHTIQRVKQGWFPFFLPYLLHDEQHNDETPTYLAEDYAFWHRARSVGVSRLADPTPRVLHWGAYPFTWEDALVGMPREHFDQLELEIPAAKR